MQDDNSVFLSYAHRDSQPTRVAGFVQFLHDCLPHRITLLLDKKHLGIGKNIPDYVAKLDHSPVAIVLLTPEYRRRAEAATGGVFPEYQTIRRRLHDEEDDFVLICVLFEGTRETAVPEAFQGHLYKDFTNFHPRLTMDSPPRYYMPDPQPGEYLPEFKELADAVESRISVRQALPQDEFNRKLDMLFAKTKITRQWISEHPEFVNHLFVTTHPYDRLKAQNAVFLIGRKGSGKSTIANILPALERDTYKTCIPISAEYINLLSTYELTDATSLNKSFRALAGKLGGSISEFTQFNPIQSLLKYSWLGLIYICLAKRLCDLANEGLLNEAQREFSDELCKAYTQFTFRQDRHLSPSGFFTTASVAFAEFWEVVVARALEQSTIADLVRFLESHINPEAYLRHLLTPLLLDSVRMVVGHCDKRALVTLDDFDSVFALFREGVSKRLAPQGGMNEPNALEAAWIQALMLLILELKGVRDGWTDPLFRRLDFCITIPRDSYLQALHADRDAYCEIECTADLEWTGVTLAQILLQRLCYIYSESYDTESNVFAELDRVMRAYVPRLPQVLRFDFNDEKVSIPLFCYVLRHGFWRPRDVLTYYAALITAAGALPGTSQLSVEQVRLIIANLTRRVERFEFYQEFSGTITTLHDVLEAFRRSPQVLSYDECYRRLKDVRCEVAPARQLDEFHEKLRILFDIGLLGLKLDENHYADAGVASCECFYFNEGAHIFDSLEQLNFKKCQIILHPLFVETLQLSHESNSFVLQWDYAYLTNNHVLRSSIVDV